MRIVKTGYKALYVVVLLGVPVAATLAFGDREPWASLGAWIALIVNVGGTYAATRIFRVAEEDVAAPRAAWRATGRPTAGFVLGGLSALFTLIGVVSEFLPGTAFAESFATAGAAGGIPVAVLTYVADLWLSYRWIRSSVLLVRAGDTIDPRPRPGYPRDEVSGL